MDNEFWIVTVTFASGGTEQRECRMVGDIPKVVFEMRDACCDDGDIVKIEAV